jgi:hypothetical protein
MKKSHTLKPIEESTRYINQRPEVVVDTDIKFDLEGDLDKLKIKKVTTKTSNMKQGQKSDRKK